MNTLKIRELSNSNSTAKIVLESFYKRYRNRRTLDFGRFKRQLMSQGHIINDKEFIDLFKKLEQEQLGYIIYNNTVAISFYFDVDVKDIGVAAVGKPIRHRESRNRRSRKVNKPTSILAVADKSGKITNFRIPKLNDTDIQALAQTIIALKIN